MPRPSSASQPEFSPALLSPNTASRAGTRRHLAGHGVDHRAAPADPPKGGLVARRSSRGDTSPRAPGSTRCPPGPGWTLPRHGRRCRAPCRARGLDALRRPLRACPRERRKRRTPPQKVSGSYQTTQLTWVRRSTAPRTPVPTPIRFSATRRKADVLLLAVMSIAAKILATSLQKRAVDEQSAQTRADVNGSHGTVCVRIAMAFWRRLSRIAILQGAIFFSPERATERLYDLRRLRNCAPSPVDAPFAVC